MSEKPPISPLTSKQNLWQAAKFTLFSASAGIIQLIAFELFIKGLGWSYGLSYWIALVLSVLWNFTFNRRYTFRSDLNVPRAMGLVFLFYVVFAPLSTWWGQALTQAGWQEDLVMVGTMGINFVTEYIYQRFVVYRGTIDTNDVANRTKEKHKEA